MFKNILLPFINILILVSAVTLPLEIKYLGQRAAIVRNVLNFIAAVIIGLIVGVVM